MSKGRRMPMGMPGGGNMNNMMKQVQKMQKQMEDMQKELEQAEMEATAGGGAITVRVTGKKDLLEVKIDPEVVDKDDVEMLEDMIVAAVNEAFRKVDEKKENEMNKVTGGLNIPGLF
ncbi:MULTISPECIES: YbaB/EbfC family nucleoid-associated protein [unclassified Sedimentibacter]|uniref:YbaB/EbfC family nucleoid-associated protein n=1 Tax=unclassified Sedimentibacter TaxID=2649220 RepID=UPI0027DFADA3|nr:YbaB/EbfC family nucleoid-associated protein [Sedimentibacter sp. MB35-C1]WMJ78257.1 YbaB/EbfC family nucleoid-associated protein [Sedimentibacter sp. MB35-C1]